ncbi:hypothetical protein C2G38_2219056 [Gigaspora rosea]|uniref:SAP domain-containing protein n=1 Tax=Gigaspora rosea TaxID=44941 RepID=A0A397U999_9GLOM|nr:hypothetical protein C2G38_2219056 [Gigaspora rosea]
MVIVEDENEVQELSSVTAPLGNGAVHDLEELPHQGLRSTLDRLPVETLMLLCNSEGLSELGFKRDLIERLAERVGSKAKGKSKAEGSVQNRGVWIREGGVDSEGVLFDALEKSLEKTVQAMLEKVVGEIKRSVQVLHSREENSMEVYFQETLVSARLSTKNKHPRVDTKPEASVSSFSYTPKVGAPIMEILYLNSSSYQHLYKNQRGPWSWSWNFQGPRSYVLNRPMRQSRGPGIVCSSARKVLYGDKEGGGSNLFREIGKVLEKSFKTSATSSVLVGKQDTTLSKGFCLWPVLVTINIFENNESFDQILEIMRDLLWKLHQRLNTEQALVEVPKEKIQKVQKELGALENLQVISVRKLSLIAKRIQSFTQAFLTAQGFREYKIVEGESEQVE